MKKAINSSVLIVTKIDSENSGFRFCSGSLIHGKKGKNYRIVTNQHCFSKKDSEGQAIDELISEACHETQIYFGFSDTSSPIKRLCKPGSLITSFLGDLAILTLNENPPDTYEPFQIWDEKTTLKGRRAFVVHYPSTQLSGDGRNAQQELKELNVLMPKKAITQDDCYIVGTYEEAYWEKNKNLQFSLRHRCDIVKGSSGSGLIDALTGKLIGVNWVNSSKGKDNVASAAKYLLEFVEHGELKEKPLSRACASVPASPFPLLFLPALYALGMLFHRKRLKNGR